MQAAGGHAKEIALLVSSLGGEATSPCWGDLLSYPSPVPVCTVGIGGSDL